MQTVLMFTKTPKITEAIEFCINNNKQPLYKKKYEDIKEQEYVTLENAKQIIEL